MWALFHLVAVYLVMPPGFAVHNPNSAEESSADILEHYVSASERQSSSLRGMQMEIEIEATLPSLKKTGKMEALRKISQLGKITYKAFHFTGDDTIKKDVIARYLEAERQSQEMPQIPLTPANYKFKYKARLSRSANQVYIFSVSPRKNAVGLFKGELWLDAATFLPVRESGRFVKTPSVFLKKVEFVRTYEIHDGVSIPSHIESLIDTRIVGPAQLSISFKNYTKDNEAAALAGGPAQSQ